MKKLFVFFVCFLLSHTLAFGQIKSDLDFLGPTTIAIIKEASRWGYWEHSKQFAGIGYRILKTKTIDDKFKWYIEFKNEYKYPVSFLYCAGQENAYKDKSNWRAYDRIRLKPGELKQKVLPWSADESFWVTVGALIRNETDKFYELSPQGQLCGYCTLNKNDPKCPQAEADEDKYYEELLFEGDAYSDAELKKYQAYVKGMKDYQNSREGRDDKRFESLTNKQLDLMKKLPSGFSNKFAYLNGTIGLGFERLPIYANSNKFQTSSKESSDSPGAQMGLQLGLFNNKPVSLHFQGFAIVGFNALSGISPGINLDNTTFGATLTTMFSAKSDSEFKAFAEMTGYKKSGNWTLDVDKRNKGNGTATTTGEILTAKYDYSVLKVGAGFLICWYNKENSSFIKPGVYLERINNDANKNYISYNLQWHVESELTLDFNVAPGYPNMGKNSYPVAKQTGTSFTIKLIKHFNLLKLFAPKN
jgi:hypothetical protein